MKLRLPSRILALFVVLSLSLNGWVQASAAPSVPRPLTLEASIFKQEALAGRMSLVLKPFGVAFTVMVIALAVHASPLYARQNTVDLNEPVAITLNDRQVNIDPKDIAGVKRALAAEKDPIARLTLLSMLARAKDPEGRTMLLEMAEKETFPAMLLTELTLLDVSYPTTYFADDEKDSLRFAIFMRETTSEALRLALVPNLSGETIVSDAAKFGFDRVLAMFNRPAVQDAMTRAGLLDVMEQVQHDNELFIQLNRPGGTAKFRKQFDDANEEGQVDLLEQVRHLPVSRLDPELLIWMTDLMNGDEDVNRAAAAVLGFRQNVERRIAVGARLKTIDSQALEKLMDKLTPQIGSLESVAGHEVALSLLEAWYPLSEQKLLETLNQTTNQYAFSSIAYLLVKEVSSPAGDRFVRDYLLNPNPSHPLELRISALRVRRDHTDELEELVRGTDEDQLRIEAAVELDEKDPKGNMTNLGRFINLSNPESRLYAIDHIGRTHSDLDDKAHAQSEELRNWQNQRYDYLAAALQDAEPAIRTRAAELLGEHRDYSRAIPILEPLLQDVFEVRNAAAGALLSLGDTTRSIRKIEHFGPGDPMKGVTSDPVFIISGDDRSQEKLIQYLLEPIDPNRDPDYDEKNRSAAVDGLWALGIKNDAILEALRQVTTTSPYSEVRDKAQETRQLIQSRPDTIVRPRPPGAFIPPNPSRSIRIAA